MPMIVTVVAAFFSGPAHASEARHCITVEPVENKLMDRMDMALKNTCPDKVYVRWCFEGDGDGGCGGDKFYSRSTSIDGKDFHTSKYGLPTGPAIHYAACFGKYPRVFVGAENLGAYACKPVVQCQGDAKPVVFSKIETSGNAKLAIYRATRGEVTYTFKLDIDDVKDISPHVLENAVSLRACVAPEGVGDMEKVRNGVMQYLKTKMKFEEDVCANAKPQPAYCKKIPSLGRRG